ncbi:MAG TPA: hypothetical protein VFS08_11805 [Gemmatimonadaceae bacterium]|nr:hypothetical protein [Gemmatimonadaceae bacterium]
MMRPLLAVALLAALPGALAAQRPTAVPTSYAPAAPSAAADTTARAGDRAAPRPAEEGAGVLTLDRESYAYASDGRRDPFASLVATGDLRPSIAEVRLVGVVYAASGGSVAMLRDLKTEESYRVRVGDPLGRMRVTQILPKQVVFTIEEFGFSRQETLTLGDPTTPRTQQ